MNHRMIHRMAITSVIVTCTMTAMGRLTTQASIDPSKHLTMAAAPIKAKRVPPSMLGTPLEFEGERAAVFASESWVTYMNEQLENAGYDRIPGCHERLKTDSFAFIPDCDGNLVFTSTMYRAAAAIMKPKEKQIDVRTGRGLPVRDIVSNNVRDIVDTSAMRREIAPAAAYRNDQMLPQPARSYADSSAYVDETVPAVLRAPVPQTRRR